ncbi:hypothetical protein AAZX31_06G011700 [Glycine max]|uniref:RRM domain-containing protein n=1 Tax=Glycine max TaxID=3847 RepID=K7KSG6_SOYBN|nr:hypothetical protein JHK87_013965 [Glycine soja]KAG5030454.1 hypothetical protein JHK85_014436 [Glycine max]KAG5147182.1 hypothetical protein JHK82_014063 [Glycine max]KAH1123646.1 hypothetical protein GYH30_013743 [Glycine max]
MTRVQVLPQNAIPDPNGGDVAGNQFVMTSLYVRDLDPNVMDAQLYDLVNQLGQVVSVRVCRDLTSRRSLGYDYVNFSNPQDVAVLLSYYIFTRLSRRNLVHLIFLLSNQTNEVDSNFFRNLRWVRKEFHLHTLVFVIIM